MKPLEELLLRGVRLPAPGTVDIGDDVVPEQIAPGVVIHPGCRIYGAKTSIGPGCVLGREAPLTLEDCQLGSGVQLKGGFCHGAVFLDGAVLGSAAQVRPGCILEEGVELAHAVGLKQTIMLPFVVGGSLLNFCDVLMAGGRNRREHSEIGSSFIHFNFTPYGDKATASLVGDVPRGVMLDQTPIFLGGQGGMTGPLRLEYGTVLAAGHVLRRDVLTGGQLVVPPPIPATERPFRRNGRAVGRVLKNNAIFVGNLAALAAWYDVARRPLLDRTPYGVACLTGALRQLAGARQERLKRLDDVTAWLAADEAATEADKRFCAAWPTAREQLAALGDQPGPEREAFVAAWHAAPEGDYLARIQKLPAEAKAAGTAWLQGIVDAAAGIMAAATA